MQEAVPAGVGAMAAIVGLAPRSRRRGLPRGRAGRDRRARQLQLAGADGDRRPRRRRRPGLRGLPRPRREAGDRPSRLGALPLRPDVSGPRSDEAPPRSDGLHRRGHARRDERRRRAGDFRRRSSATRSCARSTRRCAGSRRCSGSRAKGWIARSRSGRATCSPGSSGGSRSRSRSRAMRRLRSASSAAPRSPGPRGPVGGLRDGRAAGARIVGRVRRRRRSPPSSAVSAASAWRRAISRAGARTSTTAPRTFESASVIKIAVLTEAMAAVREGRVDLEGRWELTAANKADGSGMLLMLDPGLDPTWNDLATLMIGPSDNTATNAWINRLTVDAINARMQSLGFTAHPPLRNDSHAVAEGRRTRRPGKAFASDRSRRTTSRTG